MLSIKKSLKLISDIGEVFEISVTMRYNTTNKMFLDTVKMRNFISFLQSGVLNHASHIAPKHAFRRSRSTQVLPSCASHTFLSFRFGNKAEEDFSTWLQSHRGQMTF